MKKYILVLAMAAASFSCDKKKFVGYKVVAIQRTGSSPQCKYYLRADGLPDKTITTDCGSYNLNQIAFYVEK